MDTTHPETLKALNGYVLALADDELILGHRDSEWCGGAPILEEDIAFANIALDEIGHAHLWYGLLADLRGEDPEAFPDRLVFFRGADEFRNVQMVELPKGDWAFSIVRQYLFDTAENLRLEALARSEYSPLAQVAAKIRKEEIYHHRHTQGWVRRLGLGTQESHRRMQQALDELWPYTWQLFPSLEEDIKLVEAGYIPNSADVESAWMAEVVSFLQESTLVPPESPRLEIQRHEHTPHLKVLLSEMQSVARLEPEASW